MDTTEITLILLSAGITILSFNLLVISLFSYWKYRNIKLGLMSIVFLLFFIRGLHFSFDVFAGRVVDINSIIYLWIFDLIILVFLYITSLKR